MRVETEQVPITETSLSNYFCGRLKRQAERFNPPPHEDTCWYLGQLLDRFARSEDFFSYADGQLTVRPLALLYGDAMEASNDRHRCLILQHMGDMALFLGALFPEKWARRGIGQDYFVGMGGGAYDYLASNARSNRHIFFELANTFTRMLEMVAEACSRHQQMSMEDLLNLFQRWQSTQNPVIANQLQSLGINLNGSEALH
ncbi:MAG: hypothetical protein OXE78_10310 [Gammaproteobacteria bacterium]|nr:hypothetical protein [Gammaproteobacteria bacterium]MCY4356604.1 hypothetical protein [Gammaproteobacteria bacterium]